MDQERMTSVGIDIGTTTTSMIVSRLGMANTAASYMVPDINITSKEILYRSPVYLTPLLDRETLDGEEIRKIITKEYQNAGIRPEDIDTGAVIITGESALKKNAEIITQSLSRLAGEFVVATAGPDLESVIAGRGAGIEAFSRKYSVTAANLDIGGGTTNISLFNCGELLDQTCIDVGGRLICYNDDGRVTYVSRRVNDLAEIRGWRVQEGDKLSREDMERIGDLLADTIFDSIAPEHHRLTEIATTNTSSPLAVEEEISFLSFSGGVADCYYGKAVEPQKFNDIGVYIAEALHRKEKEHSYKVIEPRETIRATVVGAGTYTTEVSGSTISYSRNVFPIKNLPIFVPGEEAERQLYQGEEAEAKKELKWYIQQRQENRFGIALRGKQKIEYSALQALSEALKELDRELIPDEQPLIIVCVNDMAKALGQVLHRKYETKKAIICLDRIRIRSGDYLDIGNPVMAGMAVPVVVKTLIFD